jgi:3-oxoacyl-[acyl-carrier-protein] synthase-1
LAREDAFLYNGRDEGGLDLPLRGDGMARAYTQALEEAGVKLSQVGYRISDVSGEKYFFLQSALAHQRLIRGRSAFQDLWAPAESLGNIGAAALPLIAGKALISARRGYAPGSPVLIEASGDDGACGAAVLDRAERTC